MSKPNNGDSVNGWRRSNDRWPVSQPRHW